MNILGMMGQLKDMQAKMQALQEEMAAMRIAGRSGGGLVTVTLNGKGEMIGVSIDPSLLEPDDAGVLEDLIVAAATEARGRVEETVAEKTRAVTAGLPIPPGFKLPL